MFDILNAIKKNKVGIFMENEKYDLGNYSPEILKRLKSLDINSGDQIQISSDDFSLEGYLLPRIELGDKSKIILKLSNGYNIGIEYSSSLKIAKTGKSFTLAQFPTLTLSPKESLPQISLLATGGTIASRVDYLTGGVEMALSPEEIYHSLPELLDEISFFEVKQLYQIGSEEIWYKQWVELAQNIEKTLNNGSHGVVILHGTDCMHFTSAALSFMLPQISGPIAMAGGQRSSDRGSFDGALNLISASRIAANFDGAVVGVTMHSNSSDEACHFIRGTRVRKMHSSRRDAFKAINEDPLVKIHSSGKIDIINNNYPKLQFDETISNTSFEPDIALIKVFPGSDPSLLDWYIDKGIKGVIFEGTGLGHLPTLPPLGEESRSWLPKVERAHEEEIFMGMTSQCIYGRVHPYVYKSLRLNLLAGMTYLEDMLAETAYVKLGSALGQFSNVSEVQKHMLTNIAGEISHSRMDSDFKEVSS